ncbi:TspO/MBR family protein [Streptomyces sp. NPDC003327]
MRLTSDACRTAAAGGRWKPCAAASAAVAAAAAVGTIPVDPESPWYRGLSKPAWQPPPWSYGVVWTPLYASLAFAAGHALGLAKGADRRRLAALFGVNLALNAGWTWLFFGCRSPRAGFAATLLLDVGNVALIRRTGRVDPAAARALVPYAAWCAFATALNGAVAKRNT